jgi:hypothetical protein
MLALPSTADVAGQAMTKLENHLMQLNSPTYTAYYNGKMSYKLHGKGWNDYVRDAFADLGGMNTSENIFKTVIDMYAENLVPTPDELRGFSNILVPLLCRGEAPVLVTADGVPHFPEHFEMMSDGRFHIAAIYTRNLEEMKDNVIFAYSDGRTRLFSKPVPDDMSQATREGYTFVEEKTGNDLFRFALDDRGFGATLAALQDRVNHSIIDQTIIAEMYSRPFWYLLKVELPPKNPFQPASTQNDKAMEEQKQTGGTGRIFTTSSEGPFGQLTPPTISDMVSYHDSIIDKVPLTTGIAAHDLKPGQGVPPTGVALKVLSKRFNNKIARIRDDINLELERLAELLGVEKTKEVKPEVKTDEEGNPLPDEEQDKPTFEYEFWNTNDDLLQEALDAHGISLSTMGYPLKYIAEVVTPGVDLDDYVEDEEVEEGGLPADGPVDMTAMGQTGTPATPGQVAAYRNNPGQRARA